MAMPRPEAVGKPRASIQGGTGYRTVLLGLIVLAVLGLYTLVFRQWRLGLGVTGMDTPAYWGLYIVNFAYFIGLSAGGILVSALAHVGGLKRFAPVSRLAEVLAIISLLLAMGFVFVDIGRPERFVNLFIYGWTQRWSSPLVWDVTIILAYLLLALGLFRFGFRSDAASRRRLKLLAFVSVPGAVALHSITAWIFGLMVSRPGWNTALMAPLFVTSAIVSGLALVTLVAWLSRRGLGVPVQEETIRGLGGLLTWLIPVLGYLMFAELLTVMYAGSTHHVAVFRDMISGRFAGFFWYNLVFGLAGPFLLLLWNRGRSTSAVALASALVVVGVWMERYLLIIPSQVNAPLYPRGSYGPTGAEWLIMAGAYAGGALLYLLLSRRVPLVPAGE